MKIYLTFNDNHPRRFDNFRFNEAFWLSAAGYNLQIPFRIIFEWFGKNRTTDRRILKRMWRFLERTKQINDCQKWIEAFK